MALKTNVKKNADELSRFKLKLDVGMSDVLVKYAMCKYPSKFHLSNLNKLLDVLDIAAYKYNYDIYSNLLLTKLIVATRVEFSITNISIIKESILQASPEMTDIVEKSTWEDCQLTHPDCSKITDYIDEKMQYYFFYVGMPKIIKLWEKCYSTDGFCTSGPLIKEVNDEMSKLAVQMQSSKLTSTILRSFNFASPNVGEIITGIVEKVQAPQSILQTGMRALNSVLGPGFRGGKLYTFLGLSGKFKSGLLLNIADQIRQFNPILEKVVDGKRNTILFVTMENSIEETIERVYSMYQNAMDEYFTKADPSHVVDIIKNKGKFTFTDIDGIDIEIRYYNQFEIKTSNLYNIITEMEDKGQHVICLIVDYIKKIDCTFPCNNDETQRATNVSRELKGVAEYFGIPVITAQQINRMGNAVVDAAMRDGKSDLLRLVSNADIGGAWGVVEESDWVCIVYPERHVKTNQLFLTFKNTKQRAGSPDREASTYFNHPFENFSTIKLATDLDKEGCISVISLSSDLEAVHVEENVSQERPRIDGGTYITKASSGSVLDEFNYKSA